MATFRCKCTGVTDVTDGTDVVCKRERRCIWKFGSVTTASYRFGKVGYVSNNIFVQPLLLPVTAVELSNKRVDAGQLFLAGWPAAAAAGGENVRRSTFDLNPR